MLLHSKEYKNRQAPDIDTPFNMLILLCSEREDFAETLLDPNVDKDAYRAFLEITAASFFPKGEFKKYMKMNRLSEVITPSEEAFALFCFENSLKRWEWIAGNKVQNEDDTSSTALYSPQMPSLRYQRAIKKKQNSRMSAGHWTDAGMIRMIELVDKVEEKRTQREYFENELKQMYQTNCSAEEVCTGWMMTENAKKRKRAEKVSVKNRLAYVAL